MNHTEQSILETLNRDFLSQPKYLINNLYVFGWESDYLALTKAGYWYEIEVKISRSDFKADFKKEKKHQTLKMENNLSRPNYFNYIVPEDLIAVEEVPNYAGLIYLSQNGFLKTVKPAPMLHNTKLQLDLQDKFYYNWKSEKHKIRMLEKEIAKLKSKTQTSLIF